MSFKREGFVHPLKLCRYDAAITDDLKEQSLGHYMLRATTLVKQRLVRCSHSVRLFPRISNIMDESLLHGLGDGVDWKIDSVDS